MAKLGVALTEARTGEEPPAAADDSKDFEDGDVMMANATNDEHKAIKPRVFKALVGRGNAEFSSARQQVFPSLPYFRARIWKPEKTKTFQYVLLEKATTSYLSLLAFRNAVYVRECVCGTHYRGVSGARCTCT